MHCEKVSVCVSADMHVCFGHTADMTDQGQPAVGGTHCCSLGVKEPVGLRHLGTAGSTEEIEGMEAPRGERCRRHCERPLA